MNGTVMSTTRIGSASLNDAARTERVREKTCWHSTVGQFLGALRSCRNCGNCQIQGRPETLFSSRTVVCLLTSTKTKKRATCDLFHPGAMRIYQEEQPA
jgi:hypothetical protein